MPPTAEKMFLPSLKLLYSLLFVVVVDAAYIQTPCCEVNTGLFSSYMPEATPGDRNVATLAECENTCDAVSNCEAIRFKFTEPGAFGEECVSYSAQCPNLPDSNGDCPDGYPPGSPESPLQTRQYGQHIYHKNGGSTPTYTCTDVDGGSVASPCKTCADPLTLTADDQCVVCVQGYYLDGNTSTCTLCPSGTWANEGTAGSCTSYTCILPLPGCATCADPLTHDDQCAVCDEQYHLGSNGFCYSCNTPGCATCADDPTADDQCVTCNADYYLEATPEAADGGSTCTACNAGSWSAGGSAESCTDNYTCNAPAWVVDE